MDGIPPVLSTDTEDVGWALQTAEALWKRGERVDAIVWLRRAAQAAGESDDDTRAMMLARSAAELTDRLAAHSASQTPMRDDEPSHAGVDDLLSVPPQGPEGSEVFTLSGGDVEMLGHDDEEPDPHESSLLLDDEVEPHESVVLSSFLSQPDELPLLELLLDELDEPELEPPDGSPLPELDEELDEEPDVDAGTSVAAGALVVPPQLSSSATTSSSPSSS